MVSLCSIIEMTGFEAVISFGRMAQISGSFVAFAKKVAGVLPATSS
jgi:hypothetical protein